MIDPDDYQQRLSAAIDRLDGEMDFFAKLAAVKDLVDIANERHGP